MVSALILAMVAFGYGKGEATAFSQFTLDFNLAAMSLDQPPGNGKPQTVAAGGPGT